MTHTRQSFLIPELNIVSNDAQLKQMQQRMLFDYLGKQNEQKLNRSQSERKVYRNYYNPEIQNDKEASYENMKNSALYNKSFGIDLSEAYQKEMERKEAKKRNERQNQLQIQQNMIRVARHQLDLQRMRNSLVNQSFKQLAISQIQEKERKKAGERRMLEQEKLAFQRRYSTNLQSLEKQQSFRKHYNNVQDSLEKNQLYYLHNVAPSDKYLQKEKERLIENSIKKSESKLRQQMQTQFINAEKYRNELRETLVNQIREKELKKKKQMNEQRSQGYTTNSYLSKHHPINNPVDFKITHDNKYIVKELHSGLARNGSMTIVS